jgi:ankyrin repeat protein
MEAEAQKMSQQLQFLVQNKGDNLNELRALLRKGANVNYHDLNGSDETFYTPLQYAVSLQKWRVMRFLLRHGANPNPSGKHDERFMTPLMDAVYSSLPNVKFLVEYGAKVNPKGTYHQETPLMHACYAGDYEIVKYLLQKGANVRSKDVWGKTALDYVHGANQSKIVYI